MQYGGRTKNNRLVVSQNCWIIWNSASYQQAMASHPKQGVCNEEGYLPDGGLLAKYKGCMVGALVGDCLGSPFEELPRRHVLTLSELPYFFHRIFRKDVVEDERAGRRFRTDPKHIYGGYYQYTDDTAMTHKLAESLLNSDGFNPYSLARSFTEEFFENKEVKGEYGPKVRTVFHALQKCHYKDIWGPAKDQFDGTGSFGNGAAMRVAPVALYYRKNEKMTIKVAREQAELTHAHWKGYNGAILICFAIQLALTCDPREKLDVEKFLDTLISKMEIVEKDGERLYSEKLRTIKRLLTSEPDSTAEYIAEVLGNEITADRSVPTAVYAFLRGLKPVEGCAVSNGFQRSLTFVISVGGDTDTIGTMTGAIAGAYYGIFKIPKEMQNYCEGELHAERLASALLLASNCLDSETSGRGSLHDAHDRGGRHDAQNRVKYNAFLRDGPQSVHGRHSRHAGSDSQQRSIQDRGCQHSSPKGERQRDVHGTGGRCYAYDRDSKQGVHRRSGQHDSPGTSAERDAGNRGRSSGQPSGSSANKQSRKGSTSLESSPLQRKKKQTRR